jgi:hypothetical protein
MSRLVPAGLLAAISCTASAAALVSGAMPSTEQVALAASTTQAPCTSQQRTESGTPCYNAQTDLNKAKGDDFASRSERNNAWQRLQRGGS